MVEKALFSVVLKAFAADKKVALIKEIKATMPGMNLVQVRCQIRKIGSIIIIPKLFKENKGNLLISL